MARVLLSNGLGLTRVVKTSQPIKEPFGTRAGSKGERMRDFLQGWKIDKPALAIFILAFFLIFFNLDSLPFWRDEANTAGIAQNILKFGLPYVYDGRNFITSNPLEYNADYLITWQTWFPYYLTAGSFALFGKSVFAARLPFALAGFLSVVLTYVISNRLFNSRNISRTAVFLLTINVTFLLHMRQARYYSLVVLFSLWMVYSYLAFIDQKKLARTQFFLSSFLLFNSNWFSFFVMFFSLAIYFYLTRKPEHSLKPLLPVASLLLVFAFFWLAYAKPWRFTSYVSSSLFNYVFQTIPNVSDVIKYYFLTFSVFSVPVTALIITLYVSIGPIKIRQKRAVTTVLLIVFFHAFLLYYFNKPLDLLASLSLITFLFLLIYKFLKRNDSVAFILIVFSVTILALAFSRFKDIRNAIALFPLFAMLTSYSIHQITYKNTARYLIAALFLTNIFTVISFYPFFLVKGQGFSDDIANSFEWDVYAIHRQFVPHIPLYRFLSEASKDFLGAEELSCDFLQKVGKENDIVITLFDFWDTSFKFYCPQFRVNPENHTIHPMRFVYFPVGKVDWFITYRELVTLKTKAGMKSPPYELVGSFPFHEVSEALRPEPWVHKFEMPKEGTLLIYRINTEANFFQVPKTPQTVDEKTFLELTKGKTVLPKSK